MISLCVEVTPVLMHTTVLVCVSSLLGFTTAQVCQLDTRTGLPKEHQPLYLNPDDFSPVQPQEMGDKHNIVLYLYKGENMSLVCNGEGNYLLSGGKDVSTAVCRKDGEFSVEGRDVSLKTVTCKNPVKATIKPLNLYCGLEAQLYEVGFQVGERWLKVLRTCFDRVLVTTRYVQHVIEPMTQRGSVQGNSRPSFREAMKSLFGGLSMATLYRRNRQKEMLERQLDTEEYTDEKDDFLAKGHLAADADFLYSSYQHATYFFINTAPQWQQVNSANWAVVERKVRQLADRRKRRVNVTTGTHGVLKLKDSSGTPQSIYLDLEGARVPVPLYFWKAAVIGNQGIVFLGSNNPFDGPPKPHPCKDICPLHGWSKVFKRDVKAGKIICCSVEEAKQFLGFMPNLKVDSVLPWS